MTETLPATAAPSRQKLQAKTASRPKRVTGALREACDLMVHGDADGKPLEWDQAARQAGLTVRTMRLAIGRPWVRAYLKEQREIVLASLAATNLAHLGALRGSPNQMTRLGAARLVEELAGEVEAVGAARRVSPGVTIVIQPPRTDQPAMIDVTKPLLTGTIDHPPIERRAANNDIDDDAP